MSHTIRLTIGFEVHEDTSLDDLEEIYNAVDKVIGSRSEVIKTGPARLDLAPEVLKSPKDVAP